MKNLSRIMYIIVDRRGNGLIKTLSCQKKKCTDDFVKDSDMTWKELKRYGCKCVKVDVEIRPSSNEDSWK